MAISVFRMGDTLRFSALPATVILSELGGWVGGQASEWAGEWEYANPWSLHKERSIYLWSLHKTTSSEVCEMIAVK